MLTYEEIAQLARANVRVSATAAALVAQATNAEYLPPRAYLLEALKRRTKEQFDTYRRIVGNAEKRGKHERLKLGS